MIRADIRISEAIENVVDIVCRFCIHETMKYTLVDRRIDTAVFDGSTIIIEFDTVDPINPPVAAIGLNA